MILETRCAGDGVVNDRPQLAVTLRAERHRLDGLRPIAEREHLIARQRDTHRALELERRHHGEKELVLRS